MPKYRLTPVHAYDDNMQPLPVKTTKLTDEITVSDGDATFVECSASQLKRLLEGHDEDIVVKEYVDEIPERFTIHQVN